jgi:CheY-like chemotaxis protein
VAPENHHKIFQAFQRLHDNKSSGTGIGLAICQRLVERYGGLIWADSRIGHGATFRFTLPKIECDSRKPALSEQSGQWKARIVLVDDNPADVSLLWLALDDAEVNCEVSVIDDGAEALAFVRQQGKYAHRPAPDLAVLDLNLPKNNGPQLLEAISENRAEESARGFVDPRMRRLNFGAEANRHRDLTRLIHDEPAKVHVNDGSATTRRLDESLTRREWMGRPSWEPD